MRFFVLDPSEVGKYTCNFFAHHRKLYDDESDDCINNFKFIVTSIDISWNTSLCGSQFSTVSIVSKLWLDNLGDTQLHIQWINGDPSPGQIAGMRI